MGMINLKYIKEHMVFIIISLALLIMLLGVLFWNKVINYQSRDNQETTSSSSVNVSDANNVESVESKLGQPMKITQSYLIRYTTKKSGIWYMSSAVVKSVSIKNDTAIIKLISEDRKDTIVGTEIGNISKEDKDRLQFIVSEAKDLLNKDFIRQ